MGDWGASPSPVEQPALDPVGEGSRRSVEEPREAWTEWREFDSPAGVWVTGTSVAVAPRAATGQVWESAGSRKDPTSVVRSCMRCDQVCMRDRELTFSSHSVFTALTSDTSVTGEGRHRVPGPHTMTGWLGLSSGLVRSRYRRDERECADAESKACSPDGDPRVAQSEPSTPKQEPLTSEEAQLGSPLATGTGQASLDETLSSDTPSDDADDTDTCAFPCCPVHGIALAFAGTCREACPTLPGDGCPSPVSPQLGDAIGVWGLQGCGPWDSPGLSCRDPFVTAVSPCPPPSDFSRASGWRDSDGQLKRCLPPGVLAAQHCP
ncbi:hypothetical protein J1605_012944 [Eschrichtius robustus]|uniref:Uncharacterized protein n=1 Tax=Eschrichtius robustus TaxID=9764 RepID=A0AB34GJ26_ESCRO|nr:hypothetical protein J1605_012944 [Eschrichtius robustus]